MHSELVAQSTIYLPSKSHERRTGLQEKIVGIGLLNLDDAILADFNHLDFQRVRLVQGIVQSPISITNSFIQDTCC
jgi:hypothetical protein